MKKRLFVYGVIGALVFTQMSGCWRKGSSKGDSDTDSATASHSDTSSSLDSVSGEYSSDDTVTEGEPDTQTHVLNDTQSTLTDTETDTDSWTDTDSATEIASPCWETVFQDTGQRVTLVSGYEDTALLSFRCNELLVTNGNNVREIPQAELGYTACIGGAVVTGNGLLVTDSAGGVQIFANGTWTIVRDKETEGRIQIHQLAMHETDLYVAGPWIQDGLGGDLSDSTFIRWDGAQWHSVPMPDPTLEYSKVYALSDGSLVAATTDGELYSSVDGMQWLARDIMDQSEVADVWGLSASDFWVIANPTDLFSTGEYSTIYHCQSDCEDLVDTATGGTDMVAAGSGVYYRTIWGNANDDVYISGEFNMGGGCDDDFGCDKDNPVQPALLHFDGSNLVAISEAPGLNIDGITDMWGSGSGELYFSDVFLHFNGTDFLAPENRILGRIAGFAANDVYASGVQGMNRAGVHFDGADWTGLEMALPIYDIVPSVDQTVYGLGFAGEVLQWQDGITTTIRDARCRQFVQIGADSAGDGVALCSEGRLVVRADSDWQMVTALRDEAIKQFCYMGDAFVGVAIENVRRAVVHYKDGIATTLETDELITTTMACNSSGTFILTEDQQILQFDGTSLTVVAAWPQEDGIINHIAVNENGRIYADASHHLTGHLLVWDNNEWQQSPMPFEAFSLGFSNDGNLFATSVDDATIAAFSCDTQ